MNPAAPTSGPTEPCNLSCCPENPVGSYLVAALTLFQQNPELSQQNTVQSILLSDQAKSDTLPTKPAGRDTRTVIEFSKPMPQLLCCTEPSSNSDSLSNEELLKLLCIRSVEREDILTAEGAAEGEVEGIKANNREMVEKVLAKTKKKPQRFAFVTANVAAYDMEQLDFAACKELFWSLLKKNPAECRRRIISKLCVLDSFSTRTLISRKCTCRSCLVAMNKNHCTDN